MVLLYNCATMAHCILLEYQYESSAGVSFKLRAAEIFPSSVPSALRLTWSGRGWVPCFEQAAPSQRRLCCIMPHWYLGPGAPLPSSQGSSIQGSIFVYVSIIPS